MKLRMRLKLLLLLLRLESYASRVVLLFLWFVSCLMLGESTWWQSGLGFLSFLL